MASQERWSKKEQKVQQVVIDLFQALSDRDFDKLKANCTTDITILENGISWNLDTLEQKINSTKAIPDFNRINTIRFLDTRIKGKTAWISYNNQAEVIRNGKKGNVEWLESVILVKEGKDWKVQLLHSTLIKRS
jgi:ketosteroid isomerase-like protein